MKRRARADWGWALGWSGLLALVTTLPYLWAQASAGYGWRYLGFVFNPDEPNVHLSWIRQAADGAVFLRNNFTSEPHVGRFFNLFMLGAGRLAHWTGLTPYQVWAGLRVALACALPLVCFAALGTFTRDRQLRRLGLVVLTTSSGLGWLLASQTFNPVDIDQGLVMPEAITFLTLYLNPLFATSVALLVSAMVLGERAIRRASWRSAALAGLLGLLLANIHTYDAVPLGLVLTAYLPANALRRRRWCWVRCGCWALMAALVLPAMASQAHLIHSDALYAAKANTITASPSPATLLASYGLLVPLALAGAVAGLRKRRESALFWTLWAVLHFACGYLPTSLFPFQRKMLEGCHIPLAVLAASGLQGLARTLARRVAWESVRDRLRQLGPLWSLRVEVAAQRRRWTRVLSGVFALTLVPSNLLFVQSTLVNVASNNRAKLGAHMPPFALPEADYQAVRWLGEHTPPGAVVLGATPTMSYVPGLTGRSVYLGHWAETIGYQRKFGEWRRFMLGGESPEQKLAWLRQAHVTHVFAGTYEELFAGPLPKVAGLRRVYPEHGSGPVSIWAVE